MAPRSTQGLPRHLREQLEQGKVVPFVGAGVSRAVRAAGTTMPLFPSWPELLQGSVQWLLDNLETRWAGRVEEALDADDYLTAARDAREGLGPLWVSFLKEHLQKEHGDAELRSLRLAQLIWRWGSRLVITTNYDSVLHWTCPRSRDIESWVITSVAEMATWKNERSKTPILWYLHGRIHDAANVVLTPASYGALYGDTKRTDYEAAIDTLRGVARDHTLVFVGFSFDDEYLWNQLEKVQETYGGFVGPHYALVRAKEAAKFERRVKKLNVKALAFEDFGDPLERRALELARAARGIEEHDGNDHARLAEWLALAFESPASLRTLAETRLGTPLPIASNASISAVARALVQQLATKPRALQSSFFKVFHRRDWDPDELDELEQRLVPQAPPRPPATPKPPPSSRGPKFIQLVLDRREAWWGLKKEIEDPGGRAANLHVVYGSAKHDLHLFVRRVMKLAEADFGCTRLTIDGWEDGSMATTREMWQRRFRRRGDLATLIVEETRTQPLLLVFTERHRSLSGNVVKQGLPEFLVEDLLPVVAQRPRHHHPLHVLLVLELPDASSAPLDALATVMASTAIAQHEPIRVEFPDWDEIEAFIGRHYRELGSQAIERIEQGYEASRPETLTFGQRAEVLDELVADELTALESA